jgi:hypothetical protein
MNTPDNTTLNSNVNFRKNKYGYEVRYSVQDVMGNVIIPPQRFIFKNAGNAGKELALRLFGIGGPLEIGNN